MSAAGSTKKKFQYVCAHDLRAENPLHIRITQMWQAVRDETQGQLETLPWGGAGASKVSLNKLLNGEIASITDTSPSPRGWSLL